MYSLASSIKDNTACRKKLLQIWNAEFENWLFFTTSQYQYQIQPLIFRELSWYHLNTDIQKLQPIIVLLVGNYLEEK